MTGVSDIAALVAGALAAGLSMCGVFLWLFWRRTRDGLFLAFAFAFWLMAANQVAPVILGLPRESQGGVYLLRLAAFVLILLAILNKNLRGDRGRDGT